MAGTLKFSSRRRKHLPAICIIIAETPQYVMIKKFAALFLSLSIVFPVFAWWDAGHLAAAMIAYERLTPAARAKVDALTQVLERDYPQVNHFIALGPWPDDLKADGIRAYDTWHYTLNAYNIAGLPLPPRPQVDVIWAINESALVLRAPKVKPAEKARFLAFYVHFVADLHQPMHSTSLFSNQIPGGDMGGNLFALQGQWRNLHMLWDDGCGFLTPYNDINPYGEEKKPLSNADIKRIRALAQSIIREFPRDSLPDANQDDPDFWSLENHKLAVRYAYRGIMEEPEGGRARYIAPNDTPSERYLRDCQAVVKRQLALAGYRMADALNDIFGAE
jgi:hypothetical protein